MRKKIAAGNWKMNKSYDEAIELVSAIANASRPDNVITILGVPSLYLTDVHESSHAAQNFEIAAQNCHHESSGAFTGEISAEMIESVGIRYVIIGHSERREYFHETEEMIYQKMQKLHTLGMKPIYCCGEPLSIRKAGNHKEYVITQLNGSLLKLNVADLLNTIIAYEPIWAIGTGETASPEQAEEMHATIRQALVEKYGQEVAEQISILYGGSVKSSNAQELFSQPNVDGGLVGGSSLQADEFVKIINAF
jgi:triosephosphate isomerase (TIM)